MAAEDIATKRCSKCSGIKSHEHFHKDSSKKDGRSSSCKECATARASEWYHANVEHAKEIRRSYYYNNRVSLLVSMRRYREKNADAVSVSCKKWREQNRERKNQLDRQWQALNREKHLIYRRVSEHRRRAAKRSSNGQHTADQINTLAKKQRFLCACCRSRIKNGFHIDHITPLSAGGGNEITNIQLLCPSCNMKKHTKDPVLFMQENGYLI